MIQDRHYFWSCPACIHVRDLNMEAMTNRCRLIDQGAAPIDGRAWEYADHDICPAFDGGTEGGEDDDFGRRGFREGPLSLLRERTMG